MTDYANHALKVPRKHWDQLMAWKRKSRYRNINDFLVHEVIIPFCEAMDWDQNVAQSRFLALEARVGTIEKTIRIMLRGKMPRDLLAEEDFDFLKVRETREGESDEFDINSLTPEYLATLNFHELQEIGELFNITGRSASEITRKLLGGLDDDEQE